jgi:ascorbate-specific PTS system EIIC-type component UlaA
MMNTRTKTLWLPALISLTAAMVFLMISTKLALQSRFLFGYFINLHTSTTSTNYPLVVYLPWVLVLPFCGAAGAYLSRRAGGDRPARLAAGLFPAIALVGLVVFLTLIGQIVPFQHQWGRFATMLLFLLVPQGIALFLGTIPFLRDPRSRMLG